MNTSPQAKGFVTSEFFITIVGMILTALATKGVIMASDVNPILNAFANIYGGAVGLITLFAIVHSYIKSRTTVKTSLIDQATSNSGIDNNTTESV